MEPGEIIVARLRGGPTIGRCLALSQSSSTGGKQRVRVSMGRNREAQLPIDRIVLATGVTVSGDRAVAEFRQQSEELAGGVELSEVWELVRDEASTPSLDELAELYWGADVTSAQKTALVLHLERSPLHFVAAEAGYTPRSRDEVEETMARRRREDENATAAAALTESLSQGTLPVDLDDHQWTLVNHLREYAVHGDSYTRSALAEGLLGQLGRGTRDLQRLAFDLLVDTGVLSEDEPLELERAGIATRFPDEALAEASRIALERLLEEPDRRDLTALDAITIDDEDTQDRDDALSLEASDDAEETYRVGIHIADAGALVPAGGALDQEADRRMATLYTPDRKVHMLPSELSSRAGSLAPGERRAALSLLVTITSAGEVLHWEVVPSVVQSRAALAYGEADRMLEDATSPWHRVLAPLETIAHALRARRAKAGATDFEQPEMVIKIDDARRVSVTVGSRSAPARSMVAELMILCNSILGEYCRNNELPAAYRSQPAPDLSELPLTVPQGPASRYLVMRRLQPATVGTIPGAHAGLGVPVYIQATSPLRRYPDLVLQRQIGHFLNAGQPLYSTDAIASVAQRADVQLRELSRVEEDRRRYWFLKYLKQGLETTRDAGDRFSGVVLDNPPRRPALLELADYPFRFRSELPEARVQGETVTLQLHGVDLWRRTGQFVHVRDDA